MRYLLVLSFLVIASGSGVSHAQTTLTGEWTGAFDPSGRDQLYISFQRQPEKGAKKQPVTTYTYDLADWKGLSREQARGSGPANFSLTREAGTVECEGSFQNGQGSGTFRFTANQNFIAAMRSRGIDFEKRSPSGDERSVQDRLFAATILNVTTALADGLRASGLGDLDEGDLFRAVMFKVDTKFIREMEAGGYPNLGIEGLVKARIFGVDQDFIRQAAQMGFEKVTFEELVQMRMFRVTPEFVEEVRQAGLAKPSVEELAKLRQFMIDGDFIRQASASGTPLEVDKLVQRRIDAWAKE
jgi:hypothetical protein